MPPDFVLMLHILHREDHTWSEEQPVQNSLVRWHDMLGEPG